MWVSLLKNMIILMVTVISLFAGCGGSSLGYKWAGYTELLAVDFEKNAVETFKLNFPEIPIWERDIKKHNRSGNIRFLQNKKGRIGYFRRKPAMSGVFNIKCKRKKPSK